MVNKLIFFSNVGKTFFLKITFCYYTLSLASSFKCSKMAKRIAGSAVNWKFIMENLSPSDYSKVVSLKLLTDKYLREMSSKAAELPKLDWNSYKSKISASGMVDSFQKSYESLKIPYPSDAGALAETQKYSEDIIKFATDTHEEVLKETKELKEKLKYLESLMKYSEMTIEEYFLARPERAIDVEDPKPWPQQLWKDPNDENKVEKH